MDFDWHAFFVKEHNGSLTAQDVAHAYAAIDAALARSLAAVKTHKATPLTQERDLPLLMEQARLMPRPQKWRGIEASLPTGDRG